MKVRSLRLLLAGLVMWMAPASSADNQPPELVKLTKSFEARKSADLKPLLTKYGEALKGVEEKLVEAGELEKGLEVREYRLSVQLGGGSRPRT